MPVNLRGRHFLTLMDLTPREIKYLLNLSHDLKREKRAGIKGNRLVGKNIVLLFEKTSTRTRCAFEVAALDEGAHVTFLDSGSSQMRRKESLEDSARVLGRFYDGIEYRGYDQKDVELLAKHAGVPVWNGLTDVDHPTQVLADLMTIEEHIYKPLDKVKLVFVGDARNNMGYALMYGCAKMGIHFVAYAPEALYPDNEIVRRVEAVIAREGTGARITITSDIEDLAGADAIYTDLWCSMGEEAKMEERVRLLTPYRVTMDMVKATQNDDVVFMHCLPSFHDMETTVAREAHGRNLDIREVTDEVFRSRHSVVFDEAENRMHTIKAVMIATIGA